MVQLLLEVQQAYPSAVLHRLERFPEIFFQQQAFGMQGKGLGGASGTCHDKLFSPALVTDLRSNQHDLTQLKGSPGLVCSPLVDWRSSRCLVPHTDLT